MLMQKAKCNNGSKVNKVVRYISRQDLSQYGFLLIDIKAFYIDSFNTYKHIHMAVSKVSNVQRHLQCKRKKEAISHEKPKDDSVYNRATPIIF